MADRIRIPEDLVQVNANALQQANQGLEILISNVNALNASFDKLRGRNTNSIKEFANEMRTINQQTQSFTEATAQNTEKIQQNNQAITAAGKSYLEYRQANEQVARVQAQNSKQVETLTTRLSELTKQFNSLDPTIEKDGRQLRILSGEIRRTQREIDLLNKSTSNTRREFEAAEGSYNELVQANRRLTQELKSLPNGFSRTNREAQRLRREIAANTTRLKEFDAAINQNFRNVGNYSSALTGATRNLSTFASGLGLTLVPLFLLAQGFRDSVGIIRDFQKENAVLAGVLNTQRDQITDLTRAAIQYGSTTAKTATEVTGLQISFARLGFAQQEILNLIGPTIEGSIALNAGLDETATLVGAVVRSFQDLQASDSQRIIDALTVSTQVSSLSFDALSTALPKVAGAANALQIPLERVLADLAIAQDVTQDASIAGTSLRNIYIELAKTGLTYEEALDRINNSQDKLTTAVDLFGKRAAVTALGLANNQQRVEELNDSLENAAGTAERVAEEQLDTLSGSLQLLSSAWEGLILSIDEGDGVLITALRSLIDLFTEYFNAVSNSEDETRSFAAAIGGPLGVALLDYLREIGLVNEALEENTEAVDIASQAQFLYQEALDNNITTFEEFNTKVGPALEQNINRTQILAQVAKLFSDNSKELNTTLEITEDQLKKLKASLDDIEVAARDPFQELEDRLQEIRDIFEDILEFDLSDRSREVENSIKKTSQGSK